MKFLVTRELGRLAKWLRILGYDTVYSTEEKKSTLVISALRQNRIILTRNRRISSKGVRVLWIRSDLVREQISQVIKELGLSLDEETMFSRCTICNEEIEFIPKDKVKDRVPEYVFKTQQDFFTCPSCQRIYWQGTHWGNVQEIVWKLGKLGS